MKTQIFIDEVGRGALAGEVRICAFVGKKDEKILVKDSKMLSKKQRENLFFELKNFRYAFGYSSAKFIDKHGIIKALKNACQKAIKQLNIPGEIEIILDGNHSFGLDKKYQVKTIIKGDQKIWQLSAASILAKVTRDEKMKKLAKKFPQYAREKNMGYGSHFHRQAIKKYGLTSQHRKSFCKKYI